ncbi:putative transmembrane protein (PGPGW) [Mycobacteroides salmoniphilum]|uniref:Putative transmembrane protein (PGPGW) n=1 Tax=Mycobacteroides salmoniphilum TaxID=404941 RepID=A0A4V3HZ00_9MYCO|nr:TIGR02611 family protein [Mycobacteroides salmoniphilum]TDZ77632.1 putative transmembrane protein (PGPGW) [Mycobacteroides salmoniphilum]TDZ85807.1 putative transmembrane protein (PGPGW) [Mycobacteroides salmoniphilum]TDZ86295.1 putative transmembrane protein (PGPGW) [Mycobacteroides salmoniphilum]
MSRATRRWARWRDTVRDRPALDIVYRVVVAVIGLMVLGVGIIAIPYPGPGWAIVFLGLAILATEFSWAAKLLHAVRGRYDRFMAWFSTQPQWVRGIGVLFTAALVVATLWVLGALGWVAALLGIEAPWLKSPLGLGS